MCRESNRLARVPPWAFWIMAGMRFASCVVISLGCAVAAAGWSQPVAPAGSNLLQEAATAVGVKKCLPAISRLSRLAVAGSRTHDVLIDWDRGHPDEGPFFSLMGISFGNQAAAATVTTIPQGDGCTLSAERISVAPYTCESIARVELGTYKGTALLPNFTVYTRADDPGASVSLIDSPPGCLVIRRHVEYGWKDPAAQAPAAR
jgi:hypothetical protein